MNPSTSNLHQRSRLQFVIRFPMLALGIIALLAGIWSGLLRMGWLFPSFDTNWIPIHGPLMVCGFLGTVIGMERAVAQNKLFFYLAPLFTGLGALLMIFEISQAYAAVLFATGSLVLAINFAFVLKNFPSMHTAILTLGALLFFCWKFNLVFRISNSKCCSLVGGFFNFNNCRRTIGIKPSFAAYNGNKIVFPFYCCYFSDWCNFFDIYIWRRNDYFRNWDDTFSLLAFAL